MIPHANCHKCPHGIAQLSDTSSDYYMFCERYTPGFERVGTTLYEVCIDDGPDLLMLLVEKAYWMEE